MESEHLIIPMTISDTVSVCLAVRDAVRDSLALALGRLLVGLDVEVDEKTEVACKQCTTKDSSPFCPSTSTIGREQVRPVSRYKVRIS